MNEAGHMLVAAAILQDIGLSNRNLLDSPVLDRSISQNQLHGRRRVLDSNSRDETGADEELTDEEFPGDYAHDLGDEL